MDFQHVKEFLSIKGASGVQLGLHQAGSSQIHNFGESQDNSLYDIASVSKVAQTAFLFMILQEQKKLSVDDAIGKYLPNLSEELKSIKLRYFLSHTSGLPAWIPFYFFEESTIDVINRHKPVTSPGKKRVYSDVGFVLLGKVLEVISQKGIADLFESEISKPLKLSSTFHERSVPKKRCLQTSTGNPFERKLTKDRGFQEPQEFKWRDYPVIGEVNDYNCHRAFKGQAGHAGLFSNADNLLKLGKAIIEHPQFDYFTTQIHEKNSLGFLNRADWLRVTFSEKSVGHHGFTGCTFILDGKQNAVYVFLSNRQRYGLIEEKYPDYKNYLPKIS